MGAVFKHYKRRFRNALEPIFVMLVARRKEMDVKAWTALVNKTIHAINNNPVEFLGADLPEPTLVRDILDDIFSEFVKAQSKHMTKGFLAR